MATPTPTTEVLAEYRKQMVAAEQKSQEDFDKTVLALSGGALGISFTFLKDVVGTAPMTYPYFLVLAWVSWGLSTFAVLLSFHLSHLALRKTIEQVDAGLVRKQKPGGAYARATAILNMSGAALFLAGVISVVVFVSFNFVPKGKADGNQTTGQVATEAPATAGAEGFPSVHPGQAARTPDAGQSVQSQSGLHPAGPASGTTSAPRTKVAPSPTP